MLNLTIHLYKLSLLGKLTLKKIVQETAGLSQSARKWTRIGTSMSGTLCLHGQQSLYANPTRLHLIKKLKKKENSVLKIKHNVLFILH